MIIEEATHIIIIKSNKEKLDNYKLFKRESYNSVIDEPIVLGEKKIILELQNFMIIINF